MSGTWDSVRDPLAALQEGDATPFEAFVRSESRTFLAFFRRLGAAPVEAEDLVQELFLKMFRHATNYQPDGRFQAFAFRIARNAWIDHQRRRAVRPLRASGAAGDEDEERAREVATSAPAPREVVERREEAERVLGALAELSEGQRLVFELGVVQELPYAEIAELLEVPEGTVKSRMFHAVRNLRRALTEDEAAEGGEG